jgi:hypothetical protein
MAPADQMKNPTSVAAVAAKAMMHEASTSIDSVRRNWGRWVGIGLT